MDIIEKQKNSWEFDLMTQTQWNSLPKAFQSDPQSLGLPYQQVTGSIKGEAWAFLAILFYFISANCNIFVVSCEQCQKGLASPNSGLGLETESTIIDFSLQCKLELEDWCIAKRKLNWDRSKSFSASERFVWALILDLHHKQPKGHIPKLRVTWQDYFSSCHLEELHNVF